MKLILILLFIAFIELESRGIDTGVSNGDPAPGRSPGPPNKNKNQQPLIGSMYSVENGSPTDDFPTLVLTQQKPTKSVPSQSSEVTNPDNDKLKSDLIVTADDIKHSLKIDNSDISKEITKSNRDDDESNARALHALKEIPSNVLRHAQSNGLVSDSDSNNTSNGTNQVSTSTSPNKVVKPCDEVHGRNYKVNHYLKAGGNIIKVDNFDKVPPQAESTTQSTLSTEKSPNFSAAKESTEFEQVTQTPTTNTLQIDVTHDVFVPKNGILAGSVYKG